FLQNHRGDLLQNGADGLDVVLRSDALEHLLPGIEQAQLGQVARLVIAGQERLDRSTSPVEAILFVGQEDQQRCPVLQSQIYVGHLNLVNREAELLGVEV